MPNKKKGSKAKQNNNRNVPGFSSTNQTGGFSPFPLKYDAKLRYAQTIALTSGTAGVAGTENVFCLNGLYDPDITGVGHQPYGFDQLTPLYSRYIVTAVDIEVNFNTIGGTRDICAIVGVRGSTGFSTTGKTTDALTENPSIMTKTLSPYGSTRVVKVRKRVYPWIFLGLTKAEYMANRDDHSGTTTTNPTFSPFLQINASTYDGTAGEVCRAQVVLTYHVEFYERILQSAS